MNDEAKVTVDVVAFGAALAAAMKWLPVAVMFLTVIWTMIRIYETPTCQKIIAWLRSKLS